MLTVRFQAAWLSLVLILGADCFAQEWPAFPTENGAVDIPAQEWPMRPGPRTVRVLIHFPDASINSVNANTGIMLTLHNWGGVDCVGTAAPGVLAKELNVIAVCVNYLQSGPADSIHAPEPYDFGYLQALDALRALWYVRDSLHQQNIEIADDRMFCTGGSGGGNVSLMANKLAPRTFACVIDMCGMKKLSDDIAFGLPGGSDLNARWSRDPDSPNHLSIDAQELRFVGHPAHLAEMKRLGATAKIIVVHGVDDRTCPFDDARELVSTMERLEFPVEPHFLTPEMIDGKVFKSTGHSLGDRTQIVLKVAGDYLRADGEAALRRSGPSDFERADTVRYQTRNGHFAISYANGFPEGRFEAAPEPPDYPDHHHLLNVRDQSGSERMVTRSEEWEIRRLHIQRHVQRVMGTLPTELSRVPLNPVVMEESILMPPAVSRPIVRRKVSYQSDTTDKVTAWLMIPLDQDANTTADISAPAARRAAVLCLHQTTASGKDEPAGVRGDRDLRYALELAERGFVTLSPDYPSFGEHVYDFTTNNGYASGSMKAIWDNIRAVDFFESIPEVDPSRIGVIGHSLGGHNAIFTAVFESRLKVIVSSCGFTSLAEDDLPSWTGLNYMPRIATDFGNEQARMPFDFHELVASLAPRPFLACAAEHDADFAASGVRHVMQSATEIYKLYRAEDRLQSVFVDAPHSFPQTSRAAAYDFLSLHLEEREAKDH
jgi:predicted peptidase